MIPDLSKNFPCCSFFNTRAEKFFAPCYCFIYPLVLIDRVHENNIVWIESVFREHSLGENVGKLITSCILNRDGATCEVSFPSFLQYLQKKRRFRSTISDPFPSLSSYLFYWSFFHNGKCSVCKILSVVFSYVRCDFILFFAVFKLKKRKKSDFLTFFVLLGTIFYYI